MCDNNQLELPFDEFSFDPLLITLLQCGRGLGPCKIVIEPGTAGALILRCLKCGCVAPFPTKKNGHA
jgi:hypothetical protein